MITNIEGAEQFEAKKRSYASRNCLVFIPIAGAEQGVGSIYKHSGQQGLVILSLQLMSLKERKIFCLREEC